MKKRWISVLFLSVISFSSLFGCFGNEKTGPVTQYRLNDKDVVFRIDGTDIIYQADQLFEDMLNDQGIEEIYESVFKVMVESLVPVDKTIKSAVELQITTFEQSVTSYQDENGVSKEEAREIKLLEAGVNTVDELRNKYTYDIRVAKLRRDYFEDNKDRFMEELVLNDKLYQVRHILVHDGSSSYGAMADKSESGNDNDSLYFANITADDAARLYQAYNDLRDKSFATAAYRNSLDGSKSNGGVLLMAQNTSFIKEFKFGVLAFDIYSNNRNLNDLEIPFANEIEAIYGGGFDVIPSSYIERLYDVKDKGDYNDRIFAVNNSTLPRNMIFNKLFNTPGISLIEVEEDENGNYPANACEFNYVKDENGGTRTAMVLCSDEGSAKTPIFLTRGEYGIHFITVDYSYGDADAVKYFALEPNKEDDFVSYIETKTTVREQNVLIDELEGLVRKYVQYDTEDEKFMDFRIMLENINFGNDEDTEKLTIKDELIRDLVKNYIDEKISIALRSKNDSITEQWGDYVRKINFSNQENVKKYKAPLVCLDHDEEDNKVCTYSTADGFKVIGGEE